MSTEIKSSKLLKIITKASSCEERSEAQKLIKKADKSLEDYPHYQIFN